MNNSRATLKLTVSALTAALALCAGALAWPAPVRAADDTPFEQKIIGGVLQSLGLRKDGEGGINYQERAPLVLPPGRTLPPPEKGDAALASNPAWPKDPDVIKRKQEIEADSVTRSTLDMENDSRPLRPDQLNPPKVRRALAARSGTTPTPGSLGSNTGGERMSPSELGDKSGLFGIFGSKGEEENARFTGEQPRTSLTEPPPGYRTPSPDQPYGVGKDRSQPKAVDYKNDHGTQQNN